MSRDFQRQSLERLLRFWDNIEEEKTWLRVGADIHLRDNQFHGQWILYNEGDLLLVRYKFYADLTCADQHGRHCRVIMRDLRFMTMEEDEE